MRFTQVKAALAAVAAAVALLPGPAEAEVVVAPCSVIPVRDSVGTHLVVGTATAPGAVATTLRCGIVQAGVVVASFYTSMPGSVAAGAWLVRLSPEPFTVCSDVHAVFVDGSSTQYNRCP